MIQMLTKTSSLLTLCGVLNSLMNLLIQRPGESLTLRTFVNSRHTLVYLVNPGIRVCYPAYGKLLKPMSSGVFLLPDESVHDIERRRLLGQFA